MSKLLSESEELMIFDQVVNLGRTKASVARDFDLSPRTVGRVIERVKSRSKGQEDENKGAWGGIRSINAQGITRVEFPDSHDDSFDDLVDPYGWEDCALEYTPEREYVFSASPSQISITILEDGEKVDTVMATRDHSHFGEALEIVFNAVDLNDNSLIEQAIPLLSVKQAIIKASMGRATVEPDTNMVYYTTDTGEKVPFHGRLVAHLLSHAQKDGIDSNVFTRIMKFADKLSQNPSNNMLTRLYDFLVGTGVSINDDGDVMCYKKVRENYTDVFSGQFDNSPGEEVKVDRNQVDEDMNRTCSNGLHVCAATYLPHYPGERVVRVTFDPRDGVACPRDYNDAKMRVSRYQVIEDVTNEFH